MATAPSAGTEAIAPTHEVAAAPAAPAVESKAISQAPTPAAETAVIPVEAKKAEEPATEPGTIIHMEKATQKIEHDKLVSNVAAWEQNQREKIESRTHREEEKITAEETTMKKKAEARLRQKEEKLEKLRAKYQEAMKNEVAAAHKVAEEKRAMVAAKKGMDILKTEETAAKIRATGKFPVKFGCFAA
ncbi:remorin isoform X1 [Physcomitrium patens]|uniref:Remorin C-terminal domain-containing protein n=1 Tax=Physcomitrium patens TaxID=3218 RepID=A0A2K1JUP7_PHYPA|nr:uncharacterized protein At3g61260-like isoform X1 [Physcomitrium patens]PNR45247.1 hypothetical protein PHYPA_015018 [Physcomitrium patens]|eukprot:XP_024389081.1 uncharacterized protein At3g61260-like isoform X1 [Physcomitrella patens]